MMDHRFQQPHSHPRWWYGGDYVPACFQCSHFRGMIGGKVRCAAFPDGIPTELTAPNVIHNKPFPGDHGLQFEKYEE